MLSLSFGALGCSSPSATPASSAPVDAVEGDLVVGGAAFDIVTEDDPVLEEQRIVVWVERSASMISDYFGGAFPVPDLRVEVVRASRGGVGFGQHWNGRRVKIRVGSGTTDRQLEQDWVLVHEMLHACFPDLPDEHRWMQEGLSTYLEPVVRARSGNLEPVDVWGKWVRNMEVGQPRSGDRGLMHTRTWARTYWGGALFWMMVDFELRKRTDNAQSLRTALRGIIARGGNGRANWTPAKVVQVGDEVTGTTVFADLFGQLALAPGEAPLEQVWRELGVVPQGDAAALDDDAPLAGIRRAMTE